MSQNKKKLMLSCFLGMIQIFTYKDRVECESEVCCVNELAIETNLSQSYPASAESQLSCNQRNI